MVLHDVIRGYLREQTHHRCGELDRALIDAHRSLVLDEGGISAWWQTAGRAHLSVGVAAYPPARCGPGAGAAGVSAPPGVAGRELEYVGPAGLEADLALSDDPVSRALATTVRQNAHVLRPLQPRGHLPPPWLLGCLAMARPELSPSS